jgi:hypothetical protein
MHVLQTCLWESGATSERPRPEKPKLHAVHRSRLSSTSWLNLCLLRLASVLMTSCRCTPWHNRTASTRKQQVTACGLWQSEDAWLPPFNSLHCSSRVGVPVISTVSNTQTPAPL